MESESADRRQPRYNHDGDSNFSFASPTGEQRSLMSKNLATLRWEFRLGFRLRAGTGCSNGTFGLDRGSNPLERQPNRSAGYTLQLPLEQFYGSHCLRGWELSIGGCHGQKETLSRVKACHHNPEIAQRGIERRWSIRHVRGAPTPERSLGRSNGLGLMGLCECC